MKRIALDGPAGSGKSTVAKILAKKMGIEYLDTGAMYRAVTLYFSQKMVSLDSMPAVEEALKAITIDFEGGKVLLNGEDVSEAIRLPEIAAKVSAVSAIKIVREAMVAQQQCMASKKSIVMDGRDIGTVVLPDTAYKFYLTASIDARAKRRFDEMQAKGIDVSFEEIRADIKRRDDFDMGREESPLRQAEDAILIDTTNLEIDGVVSTLMTHIERIAKHNEMAH